MRCFVALSLPPPVRNHLEKVTAPLRDRYQVKWVPSDQMHVSLAFAGDLPDENVDALIQIVQTLDLPTLQLSLDPFGWFPPRGVPRVIWVGLGGDVEALTAMQADLTWQAAAIGVPPEKRGFTPHVTLGRIKSPFGALALLDKLKKASGELNPKPFAPPAVVLYRSTLTPSGPYYEPLVHRPMDGGPMHGRPLDGGPMQDEDVADDDLYGRAPD